MIVEFAGRSLMVVYSVHNNACEAVNSMLD
jgi:hypothetical protein